MIKFIIGLISLIFVALAVYVYIDKKGEDVIKSAVTHKVLKKELPKRKTVEVIKDVSNKKFINEEKIEVTQFRNTDDALLLEDSEYKPNENRSSVGSLSDKEWDKIEKYMIDSGKIKFDTAQKNENTLEHELLGLD